ncbi:MAG: zinc ribbon domain-containing protein [Bacteroidota bacterium]
MKKECPSCAMMIEKDAQVCPICQYEFPRRGYQNKLKWIAILLAVLFLLVILL